MTTRLAKISTTSRKLSVVLHCPSCRMQQRCKPVGTAVVDRQRREVVQCTAKDCELLFVPERRHVPKPTPFAAP